ncbi:MAG: class II fumarate hydratase [Candidatus Peribacteraceae bacterium]|jgi:fumarate hydratase class II
MKTKTARLYGAQTERAITNFPISGIPMPEELISALALIKEYAAIVNGELGEIPAGKAHAIASAARSICEGKHRDQFPVDVFQTGSGTSTNMNMNEVLAALANAHPHDEVNRCQSSNDVIPSAIQIACAIGVRDRLLPSLASLRATFNAKARAFRSVVKTGRTHLMDAVPVSLGAEFASYAALLAHAERRLRDATEELCVLPLGGTAAGTGLNAHPSFAPKTIARMRTATKLPLKEADDHIAAQSCPLALQTLAAALKETSLALTKAANDIRLMASGPVAGLAEIILSPLQAGSSIMPGKVNPVLCESVLQVGMETVGMDATVTAALAQVSNFELNVALPVMAHVLLSSVRHLANVTSRFDEKCVSHIQVNRKLLEERAARNPMLATALNAAIGYDKAAEIVQEAVRTGETIFSVAQRRTKIPRKELKEMLDPKRMLSK